MSISKEQMRDIYTRMCRIRAFETAASDCSGRVRVPAGG